MSRDDEADADRAIPPRKADEAQETAQQCGHRMGDDDRRVMRLRHPVRHDHGDDEGGGHGHGGAEQVEPQRDGQLEPAFDRVGRYGPWESRRQRDGDGGGQRDAPALSAHGR